MNDDMDAGRALLKLFAVVIVTTGGSDGGVITYANELFCALSGWSSDELVGQPLNIVIPEKSRAAHEHYRQGFGHRPSTRPMGPDRAVVLLHRDGSELPVWVGLDPSSDENPETVTAVILPMSIGRSYGMTQKDSPAGVPET
jgi:PAS domain S-box-containing protein